jgi:hypothetical protein
VEYLADVLPRLARGLRPLDMSAMLPAARKAALQASAPAAESVAAPVN